MSHFYMIMRSMNSLLLFAAKEMCANRCPEKKPALSAAAALRWAGAIIVTGVSIAYLATLFDAEAFIAGFAAMNLWVLVFGLSGVIILNWVLRGLRWYALNRDSNPEYSLERAYCDNAVAQAVAEVTPSQSGEAIKIVLAARKFPGTSPSFTAAFAVERAMDGSLYAAMAFAGLIFAPVLSAQLDWWAMLGILALGGALCAAFFAWWIRKRQIPKYIQQVLAALATLEPMVLVTSIVLTVLQVATIILLWWWSFMIAGVEVSLVMTIFLIPVSMMAGIISFLPGGLGASDVSLVALLVLNGTSPEAALLAAAVLRLTSIYVAVLGGAHYMLRFFLVRRSA
ncbi:MAG: flippase-like domain-containing protein [Alphaproteobacteria bacterium]|nr:flippase-like domain-containing protein [Alphaproteobacteria bacterium]